MIRRIAIVAAAVALAVGPLACSSSGESVVEEEASGIEEPVDGIFKSTDALAFKLEAPFQKLFDRFKAQQADPPKERPDGGADAGPIDPNDLEPNYSEPGVLKFRDKSLDIRVQIRGNTSPIDCAFPKYKIEFANKDQLAGTPFQGNKKFRVNSHCGSGGPEDRGGRFNRIQNQISPIREELVYRTIRAAGVPTYRTRLAKIGYTDTSEASPLAPMEHYGLMIEAGDIAAKRFAQEGLVAKDSVYFNDPKGRPTNVGADTMKMKDADMAKIFLAEALIGNLDWQFYISSPGQLWNIDVFGVAGKQYQLPIPQDFDLACGVHASSQPASAVANEMYKFRSQFSGKEPGRVAIAHFKEHKAAILAEIEKVEKYDIEEKLIPVKDGKSTDTGFLNAHALYDAFYGLEEFTK